MELRENSIAASVNRAIFHAINDDPPFAQFIFEAHSPPDSIFIHTPFGDWETNLTDLVEECISAHEGGAIGEPKLFRGDEAIQARGLSTKLRALTELIEAHTAPVTP